MRIPSVITAFTVVLAALFIFGGSPTLYSKEKIKKETTPVMEEGLNAEEGDVAESVGVPGEGAIADDTAVSGKSDEGSSLYYTIRGGGVIMIPIIILGFLSLTVIIERLIFYTKNGVWDSYGLVSHIEDLARRSGASYREDMEDYLRGEFQVYVNGLERGLGILAGIGNLAPIIGFLGTVVGLIDAFASIVAATTVTAKVVAGGIQIALVTTAGGLTVAAPTLVFYYLFTTLIQNRFSAADETIAGVCAHMPRMTDQIDRGKTASGRTTKTGAKAKSKR
ncbi:MAG: MotA/TolQ/ExbB proton channel family protein [Chrysiogenales bacterium]|nr:MAG: MotA/TolQ/ExbB proton channel family protein [Chrysiogenales bacterium]